MSCDTAVDQRRNHIGISVLCHPFIAKLKEQTRPRGVWFQARAAGRRPVLRVSQDDDDGVIRVDDDPIRRTAPLGVLSGAVVGVVTALPSRGDGLF